MDTFLSQYAISKRIRNFLEPQDYINLLRSRNEDYRHRADRSDIVYCLNPVNFLFQDLGPMIAWKSLYGCSFVLCGNDLARLHEYLVGNIQRDKEAYDIVLVIAFEDLQSYQRALLDTLNGVVGDIHDEIRRSVREQIVSFLPDTQNRHGTIVRLHSDLQVSDSDSLSFFKENRIPDATRTICDSTRTVFVCSHAAEPLICLPQLQPIFPSCTATVVLLGTLSNPKFISVRKCHICSSS